jgi:glycerate 2-kinase
MYKNIILNNLPPSIQPEERRYKVASILSSALSAVEPATAVKRALKREGDHLLITGKSYHLPRLNHIWIIGAGKAGVPMAQSVVEILGNRITGGVVIVKEGFASGILPENIRVIEAGHPIPDERGQAGAKQIEHLLRQTQFDDLVICLISGGGSALLPHPVNGVSLADLQQLSQHLLDCGASVVEINTLRKHLDQFKGGQLVRQIKPASAISLILSDVVGNPLDTIASGLTVPDPSTFQDAYNILQKYHLVDRISPSIVFHLQQGMRGEIPETPKPGHEMFRHVQNEIIGSNMIACQATQKTAQEYGFNTQLLTTYLQGEANQAGRFLASILRQITDNGLPLHRPACLVVGGETTVTVKGDGKGGRNLELALAAAMDLSGLVDVALITLATDGNDGPTDAAGAYVDGETMRCAEQLGLNPLHYLENNDSYHFFEHLGGLIKTGPTQTNVNDVAFLFAF